MNFELFPDVPCENVTASESLLWSDNGHCYTRHDVDVEFFAADDACAAISGHLLTITSASENAAVAALVVAPARTGFIESSSWIWLDGEPVPYENWGAAEPMACPTGAMSGLLTSDGTWTATCVANRVHPFFCEIEPWLTRAADGHRYRILWQRDDWFGSSARCEELGGHLATITSFDEAAFVAPILTDVVWLGANSSSGSFAWVTGESFGSYATWATNQPDGPAGQCLASSSSQDWFDTACTTTYHALCEVE
ncbi:MAG TPA: C-type lectin domain-containing protein [Kofleriaceae bacterium]|nr:C-type lectin domain-containing protein [Kofleriaceae bacterium]